MLFTNNGWADAYSLHSFSNSQRAQPPSSIGLFRTKILARSCCRGTRTSSASPDLPNARHPVQPAQDCHATSRASRPTKTTPARRIPVVDEANQGLDWLFTASTADDVGTNIGTLEHNDTAESAAQKSTKRSWKFSTVLRKRGLRETASLKRSLLESHKRFHRESENNNENIVPDQWLGDKSAMQDNYDADAQLLDNSSQMFSTEDNLGSVRKQDLITVDRRLLRKSGEQGPCSTEAQFTPSGADVPEHDPPGSNTTSDKRFSVRQQPSFVESTSDPMPEPNPRPFRLPATYNEATVTVQDLHHEDNKLEADGTSQASHANNQLDIRTSWVYLPKRSSVEGRAQSCSIDLSMREKLSSGDHFSDSITIGRNDRRRHSDPEKYTTGRNADKPHNSSCHLQEMRISKQLRPLSSLSADSGMGAPLELLRDHSLPLIVECVASKEENTPIYRRSSSGFESVKVPATWGKVVKAIDLPSRMPSFDGPSDAGMVPQQTLLGSSSSAHNHATVNSMWSHTLASIKPSRSKASSFSSRQPASTDDDQDPLQPQKVPSTSHQQSVAGHHEDVGNSWGKALTALRDQQAAPNMSKASSFLARQPYPLANGRDPSQSLPVPSTSRKESVARNYEDVGSLWGKAFTAFQDQQTAPRKSKASSFLNARHDSHGSSKNGSFSGDIELQGVGEEERRRSIEFRPIHAEHSFDLLKVSGRGSIDHPAEGVPFQGMHPPTSQFLQEELRPLPPTEGLPVLILAGTHADDDVDIPDIVLTEAEPAAESLSYLPPPRTSISSIKGWGRFPSHTRAERNNSAGIPDDVIQRDFAPRSSSLDVELDNGSETNPETIKKRKSQKAKGKSLIWSMKLLTMPGRLIKRSHAHRVRGSGHRTSISLGGSLEYPELELLGGREPQASEGLAWNELSPLSPSMNATSGTHSRIAGQRGHTSDTAPVLQDIDRPGLRSPIGSSNYGSPVTSETGSAGRDRMGWSANYGQYTLGGNASRYDAELVSPLDGAVSRLQTSSAISLPLFLRDRMAERERSGSKLRNWRTRFDEQLRESTQDLRRILDAADKEDALNALRAAETAWGGET